MLACLTVAPVEITLKVLPWKIEVLANTFPTASWESLIPSCIRSWVHVPWTKTAFVAFSPQEVCKGISMISQSWIPELWNSGSKTSKGRLWI